LKDYVSNNSYNFHFSHNIKHNLLHTSVFPTRITACVIGQFHSLLVEDYSLKTQDVGFRGNLALTFRRRYI